MAGNLSALEHHRLLVEALSVNTTFKSLGKTIPYPILLDGSRFNVYIKNLSSAHFRGSADVWRAQLPKRNEFEKIKLDSAPFIFLGYDSTNDVYATWNPHFVKQRLNEVQYVSFYSRLSGQVEAHTKNIFVRKQLNNDGEVLIFPRSKLNSYLVNFASYFPDNSEYVAMGSKRRKEANETYRLFNDPRNVSGFAKYLEQKGQNNISGYCKIINKFISLNLFSCHRKIFLAYDSISQYKNAIKTFLSYEDVKTTISITDVNAQDALDAYMSFLTSKIEESAVCPVGTTNDNCKKQICDTCFENGKIVKITDKNILLKIEPYLHTEYSQPIPAMNIVRNYYEEKFPNLKMELKDWMNLIAHIDWTMLKH